MAAARDKLELREPVTVKAAARAVNRSPATIRRWLREGAPCVQQGASGPGKGALVAVADLLAWRSKQDLLADDAERELRLVARVLLDTYLRDARDGKPAHAVVGILPGVAVAYLFAIFERAHLHLRQRLPVDADPLPDEIHRLLEIAKAHANVRF